MTSLRELVNVTEQILGDVTVEDGQDYINEGTPTIRPKKELLKRRDSMYDEPSRPSTSSIRSTFPSAIATVTENMDDELEVKLDLIADPVKEDLLNIKIQTTEESQSLQVKEIHHRTLSIDDVLFVGMYVQFCKLFLLATSKIVLEKN